MPPPDLMSYYTNHHFLMSNQSSSLVGGRPLGSVVLNRHHGWMKECHKGSNHQKSSSNIRAGLRQTEGIENKESIGIHRFVT